MNLEEQLAEELGGDITDLRRLSAGASRETWSFSVDGRPLILQRNRTGGLTDPIDEPALLRHAHAGGVTVPEIVRSSASGDHPIGPSFTISERVEGESIARKILRDDEFAAARSCFVADCGRELAAIHALDPAPVEGFLALLEDPVAAQRSTFDLIGDPHPVFELAFRWLDDNRPAMGTPTVVHGDFRMGNLLVGASGLTAVLDWELAHRGDPAEDLGWLCARAWRFGGDGAVGGIGTREDLVAAYVAAGGREIPLETLRWWEVLATLRWGVITMFMGAEYRSGASPSMEQAAIGRRVVENEYDILLLLRPELAA
ncbi:MAG: phosphotransferase family protein [Acidimicrobiales bacterium]|nr:phosphotransferase family protein [Acidimicrobiales bacterium]